MAHLILLIICVLSMIFNIVIGYTPFTDFLVLDDGDDIEVWCQERKCIRKCCDKDEYYSQKSISCEYFDGTFNFSNIPVYDDYHFERLDKSFNDIFLLVPRMFYEELEDEVFVNTTFADEVNYISAVDTSTYLTENGMLYLMAPNSYTRWHPIDYFCVDYDVGDSITPKFWSVVKEVPTSENGSYSTAALLVSCAFLSIVLLVYIILPELRNLVGKVLMAYVVSLMGTFLSLASIQIGKYSNIGCLYLTAFTYFFFLSSFCWMNVMSFDIWWTFRGYAKARLIHRRGENFKFGMYSLYAWGIPLAMTIFLVILNEIDLKDKPWIIQPQIVKQGCFLEGGQKFLYLYVPITILITWNWLFFLMTAFNIWRISRETSVLDTAMAGYRAKHRQQRNRFLVYIKLSVIMGINWMLEIVSFLTPKLEIWNFTDAYNIFIGVLIFFIFVCKKKIYRKLQKRYYSFTEPKPTWSQGHTSTSTLKSYPSQDVHLPVSNNPMGHNGEQS